MTAIAGLLELRRSSRRAVALRAKARGAANLRPRSAGDRDRRALRSASGRSRSLPKKAPADRRDVGRDRALLVADATPRQSRRACRSLGLGRAVASGLGDALLLLRALERWEDPRWTASTAIAFAYWNPRARRCPGARFPGREAPPLQPRPRLFRLRHEAKGLHVPSEVAEAPDNVAIAGLVATMPEDGSTPSSAASRRSAPGMSWP